MISNPGDSVTPERHFYLHLIDMIIDAGIGEFAAEATNEDLRNSIEFMTRWWACHYAGHFNVLSKG